MLASIPSATLHGVDGRSVSVEVHVSTGLPGFTIVGLPDAAVRESRDRVRAALLSCALPWPSRRVTVNLAPSDVRKGGTGLDLRGFKARASRCNKELLFITRPPEELPIRRVMVYLVCAGRTR